VVTDSPARNEAISGGEARATCVNPGGAHPLGYRGKRVLDLIIIGLVALPVVVLAGLCAAIIWLDDGRPVLFRQVRVGHGGHPFVLLKFRTMHEASAARSAFPDLDNVTRSGRWLRRLSIDELPQLINVVRGEMSAVGPRPTLHYQVERYDEQQRGRLRVLPGLTGLAQVHGRNRMSWAERIEWDLRYVEHQSLRLDLAVLVATVRAVLTGDGVSGHPVRDPISQMEGRHAMPPSTPRIRLAKPDIGEEETQAIRRVLASGVLTNGPENAAFEREFAARHRCAYGVTFASGTVALAAMLLAEGIGPGHEVIVPSMTFISTATSVLHVGAVPVFADIDPESLNLDPAQIEALVTGRTRAVMTVHYGGQAANLDTLQKVCADHGLLLLEDAAQAAGGEYAGMPVGTFGKSAMFSFTPTKNLTTGEGAMVLTGDTQTAERLRLLRNHGQRRQYEHVTIGYNWRLTEMQAAMGREQLRKLDGILARKQAKAAWMSRRLAELPGLTPPKQMPHSSSTHMLYTCRLDHGRDAVLEHLNQKGIEARIYFPPAHRQPIFASSRAALPVTEEVASRILSIPMHAQLSQEELELIADVLTEGVQLAQASR
jgi:perosamine synthetase